MWRYLHEERRPTPGGIDYAGAALLTTSITAFMFALLAVGEGAGWLQWQTGGLVVLSLALLGLFLRQERRFPNPMIPLDLFSSRLIAVVTGAGVLIGGVMFGVSSYIPLFIQGALNKSPVQAGIAVAPFAIGWSAASIVSGRVILRAGYRVSVVAGVISAVIGATTLLLLSRGSGQWPTLVGAGFVGIGMGLSATAMLISVQNSVGWNQRGVATALVQFSRTIGGAVGVAALGTLLTSRMAFRLSNVNSDEINANALLDLEQRATLSPGTVEQLRDALARSLHDVYLGMFVLALIAMAIIVVLFPRGTIQELQSTEGGLGAPRPTTPESPAAASD